jgi:hypothetical protein
MLENIFTPEFIVGFIIGFIVGTIVVEMLMSLYWKREVYPLYLFKQAKEEEAKLHKLLEEGVSKGYYTKEETIIGGKND